MSSSERSAIIPGVSNELLNDYLAITRHMHVEGRPDEMKSSPVRRTFCLLVLFDFILVVLVWILHVQVSSGNLNYREEVIEYKFNISLFDTVALAALRFTYLEVIYGGIKSTLPWWIAGSTTASSGFAIVKMCLLYISFDDQKKNPTSVSGYITLIVTFAICWMETIFLVYMLLPKERAARQVLEYNRPVSQQHAGSSQSLPSDITETGNRLSPSDSADEEFFSPRATRPASPTHIRIKEIQHQAKDLSCRALALVRNTSGWTYSTGDAVQGCVTYKVLSPYKGKIFKIETLLNVSAHILFNDMITNCHESSSWNPHVRLVKKIESISKNVDILYNLSNEALRGYISPRDFVLLRTWDVIDGCYMISMMSFLHDDCPPEVNIVRGEYGIGAIYLQSSINDSNQCKCIWLMNNDIKGNLFKPVVDRAVPGILLEIIVGLRAHCSRLMVNA